MPSHSDDAHFSWVWWSDTVTPATPTITMLTYSIFVEDVRYARSDPFTRGGSYPTWVDIEVQVDDEASRGTYRTSGNGGTFSSRTVRR